MVGSRSLNQNESRQAKRAIIYTQCLAMLAATLFESGIILLYFKALLLSPSQALALLSLSGFTIAFGLLPASLIADRIGKKRCGQMGIFADVLGFGLLIASGWVPAHQAHTMAFLGILVVSLGNILNMAGWFALLSPIIEPGQRGRFFARLRLTFQSVGLIFLLVASWVLEQSGDKLVFQSLIAVVILAQAGRYFFYSRIPELEHPVKAPPSELFSLAGRIIKSRKFMLFCGYAFLYMLFTGGINPLFVFVEKFELGYSEGRIVFLSNLFRFGLMSGFLFGGSLIDFRGTRPVILISQAGIAAAVVCFSMRELAGDFLFPWVGAIHFAFGMFFSLHGLALTSQLLGLMQERFKSVYSGIFSMLMMAGYAVANFMPSFCLKYEILPEHWQLAGIDLSSYDLLLLVCASMLFVLLSSIYMVPDSVKRAFWIPRGSTSSA